MSEEGLVPSSAEPVAPATEAGSAPARAFSAAVALNGVTVPHFLAALVLLGGGWNFMYTGGTTMLMESYAPAEKARAQGANDFIVFATMGVSSLASGVMVSAAGWEAMNRAVLPLLAATTVVVVWFAWRRRVPRPRTA